MEFADFNPQPKEPAMTKTTMNLAELLEKHDEGDFLRAVAETVLQLMMETDVEGVIGAGRHERAEGRTTYRIGYRDRALGSGRLTYGCRSCARAVFSGLPGASPHGRESHDRCRPGGLRSGRLNALCR